MKLELKHLSPYLPYGLKYMCACIMDVKNDRIETMHENNIEKVLNGYGTFVIKPILRPLSDLTKEIEHNGEKFIPIELLNTRFRQCSKDLVPYKTIGFNLELEIQTECYSQSLDLFDGYLITQQLFEWHFDVFGLIENNLAIDINTLKND